MCIKKNIFKKSGFWEIMRLEKWRLRKKSFEITAFLPVFLLRYLCPISRWSSALSKFLALKTSCNSVLSFRMQSRVIPTASILGFFFFLMETLSDLFYISSDSITGISCICLHFIISLFLVASTLSMGTFDLSFKIFCFFLALLKPRMFYSFGLSCSVYL